MLRSIMGMLVALVAAGLPVWDNVAKQFRRADAAVVDVASASRASGNSGTIEGAHVRTIDALVDVTVAGTTLNVALEESSDGATWAAVANVNQNAVGQTRLRGLITRRFYRYVWTVTGGNYTFSIAADKKVA